MTLNKYKNLVNFETNKNFPRHSWFDIKEGYSSDLIKNVLSDLKIKKSDGYIMDPFSGSGTTILTSSILGYKSIGIEVNPFLYYLSKIKCINYSKNFLFFLKKFKKNNIEKQKLHYEPKLSISKKLFKNQLSEILKIKNWISEIKDRDCKKLFFCAYLCSLDKASFAKKDGNGLKYPKNKVPEKFKDVFISNLEKFIDDTKKVKIEKKPHFLLGNNLQILSQKSFEKKYKNKIALCVFSPPYANCFDYTEVYKTELWFGDFVKEYKDLKILRNKTLSSHLNKKFADVRILKEINSYITKIKSKKLWSKKIVDMLINYFHEMDILLKKLNNLICKNGKCVVVVGNSSYGNIAIPTDEILKKLAKKNGFKNNYIIQARKLGTSSQQYKKIDNLNMLRESLVVLSK
ncbi:site-specific DNA-methyltransferase [Candidatus Pelagibacter sp.]|nr:site-specific DNA-methyltransferase [Candidatus Pelagibacter sp.]